MDRRVYLLEPDDPDYVVGIFERSYKNVLGVTVFALAYAAPLRPRLA